MAKSSLALQKYVKGRGCLSFASRIVLGLTVTLTVLIPIGLAYQARALRIDRVRFPPPGRMVSVDEFRLHLYCQGSGSPTIILEAGLGDGALIWSNIIAPLAEHSQVCAYDRPGLGWSDFVRRPIDQRAAAANLHSLLVNAAVPGPYLLVGHSIGGLYIRAYANRYPHEVAGMVFVDSAHENQSGRRSDRRSDAGRMLDRMLNVCAVIAPTGIFRVFGLGNALMEDTGLPLPVRQAAAATIYRNTYCRTIANELNTSDADTSLAVAPENLGDIPLVVLVAGQDAGVAPDNAPSEAAKTGQGLGGSRWLSLQEELARLSTHSKLVVANGSSHYIHLDRPDLVIHSILELLEAIR